MRRKCLWTNYVTDRNQSFYMADLFLEPGQEASAHDHDYYEFFIVLQGEFTEESMGSRTKVARRQGHILRPEDVHCLKNDSDRPALLRNIAVRRDTFEGILAETGFFSESALPVSDSYQFFGCGEYMLAQKSIGTPNTALNVAKILELVLHDGINPATGRLCGPAAAGRAVRRLADIRNFQELMELLEEYLSFFIDISGGFEELLYDVCSEEACFLQYSALLDDCMAKGRPMLGGGLAHLGGTVETYGNITLADSMTAIWHTVYQNHAIGMERLVEALDHNFDGYEEERRLLLAAPKFGNDHEEADAVAVRLHEFICGTIRDQRTKTRMDSFLAVIINNNKQHSGALCGRYAGRTAGGDVPLQRRQPL